MSVFCRYESAARLLEETELRHDADEERQRKLMLKLFLNRGLCYLKVQWPKKVCVMMQEALKLDPRNSKALYRMALAKRMLANYKDARRYTSYDVIEVVLNSIG